MQAMQSVYKQCRFYMNIFLIYVYICEQSHKQSCPSLLCPGFL